MTTTASTMNRNAAPPGTRRLGGAAVTLAAAAGLGGIATMAWLASLLDGARGCNSNCPAVLQDPTQPHETLMQALAASQVLWTVLGIVALVLGARALARSEKPALPRIAIAIALLAPIAVIGLFWHTFG